MKLFILAFIILFASDFAFSKVPLSTPSKVSESRIILPLNNWASQRIVTMALGEILMARGIPVEYKNISSNDQWGALRKGLVHIQLEVWQASMAKDYQRMLQEGHITDMGEHSARGKEDWWYPDFVEKFCPELPNWQALNKCAFLFATPSSAGKGIYHAGPWDYGDGDIIRALKLNFVIKRHANDTSLWQELRQSTANNKPIMLLNWTPNWTDTRLKGKFVKFPAYSKACEEDASWGVNKHLVKDCANPSNGWIKKTAWSGLDKQWPCVNQFVKKINFTTSMLADASALLVNDGYSEAEAVQLWLNKYQKETHHWLAGTCI